MIDSLNLEEYLDNLSNSSKPTKFLVNDENDEIISIFFSSGLDGIKKKLELNDFKNSDYQYLQSLQTKINNKKLEMNPSMINNMKLLKDKIKILQSNATKGNKPSIKEYNVKIDCSNKILYKSNENVYNSNTKEYNFDKIISEEIFHVNELPQNLVKDNKDLLENKRILGEYDEKTIVYNKKLLYLKKKLLESDIKLLESEKKNLESEKSLIETKKKLLEFEEKLYESEKKLIVFKESLFEYEKKSIESEEKLLESNEKSIESEEKLLESNEKSIESEEKLLESDKKPLKSKKNILEEF